MIKAPHCGAFIILLMPLCGKWIEVNRKDAKAQDQIRAIRVIRLISVSNSCNN